MYNQNFINHLIEKFELNFIDFTESKYTVVYNFKKNDIIYKFSVANFNSKNLEECPKVNITLITNKILSKNELYIIFSEFGYISNSHLYINDFFHKMIQSKFSNSSSYKKEFDIFSIYKNSNDKKKSSYNIDVYNYEITSYFYGKVFYNEVFKEKNEKKLAKSSSVEIKPEFRIKQDKLFFQENVKFPFTFKNKLYFYINKDTNKEDFEIYLENNILDILRKKIVSKKILKKNEAYNLSFEELQKYIPYLEILNY